MDRTLQGRHHRQVVNRNKIHENPGVGDARDFSHLGEMCRNRIMMAK